MSLIARLGGKLRRISLMRSWVNSIHTSRCWCKEIIKGDIAAMSPIAVDLVRGQEYKWCACGLSKKQPFCDGSHVNSPLGLEPITFKAEESKPYFLCRCKQTDNRPFCDSSHKRIS